MLDQSNNTHIFLTRWRLINLCLPFLLTILIEDSIGMVGMAGEIRIFSNFVVDIGGEGAIKQFIMKNISPESDLIHRKSFQYKDGGRRSGVVSASSS